MADRSLDRHAEKDRPRKSESMNDARSTATPAVNAHPILRWQRTAGNRTVLRMLQTSLAIGRPDDDYEHEAELMAERVGATPRSAAIGAPPLAPIRRCAASPGAHAPAAPPSVDHA